MNGKDGTFAFVVHDGGNHTKHCHEHNIRGANLTIFFLLNCFISARTNVLENGLCDPRK